MFPELDLSVEEGLKVLASADMCIVSAKYGLQHHIQYKDEWWELCRTDLTDNVVTGCPLFLSHVDVSNSDEVRNYFAEKIRYGIRLVTTGGVDTPCFCCIDSWSDG